MATAGFLFLEITQPEIRSLLWRMQCILSGAEPLHPVHVTLRGPYMGRITPLILKKSRDALCNDTLRIGGVGRFKDPEQVVFLRVDSPNLRRVCWKRDYPKKDGHEPHISLYRGPDAAFADRAADFLAREGLELSCSEYRLWIHRNTSLHLPSPAGSGQASASFGGQQAEPLLIKRLRRFVDDYRDSVPPRTVEPAGDRNRTGSPAAVARLRGAVPWKG